MLVPQSGGRDLQAQALCDVLSSVPAGRSRTGEPCRLRGWVLPAWLAGRATLAAA